MPVVTFANECRRDGIKESRSDSPRALVKVARVLVKDHLHEHAANDDAIDLVGVLRPKTLSVALHPLAEFVVTVPRLLDSRCNPSRHYTHRIKNGLPTELKFLRGSQWRRIRFITDEVVRKYAEQALLLLGFQLLRRELMLRETNIHLGGCRRHLQYGRRQRW